MSTETKTTLQMQLQHDTRLGWEAYNLNLTLPVLEKWSGHKPLQTCHRQIISFKEQAPLLLNEHILQWCGRGQQQGLGVDPTNCKRHAPWAAVQPDKRVLPMCCGKKVVVQLRPFLDEAHDDFSSVGTMDEFPQPLSRRSIRAWRAIAARRGPP